MPKALLTFGVGEHSKYLEITKPRMIQYAELHGYGFSDNYVTNSRPPSWWKIPLIKGLLRDDYDVLWLDADVFIKDLTYDISHDVHRDSIQGLVLHNVNTQYIPNCGVWYLKKGMIPYLELMWGMEKYIHHCFWEQAALIKLLNGSADGHPRIKVSMGSATSELDVKTTWLDYKWNYHPLDNRRMGPNGYFYHATQFDNRLETLRLWSKQSP